jgi:hypothetical protein
MNVGNLLSAVRVLDLFLEKSQTIAPFATWIGDAGCFISHSLAKAGITNLEGKLKDDVKPSDALTAVLLLCALRAKFPADPSEKPAADFTPPLNPLRG